MNRSISYLLFVLMLVSFGCKKEEEMCENEELTIQLRWVPSYTGETLDDAITGLKWSLSFLGAELPIEHEQEAMIVQSSNLVLINFELLGFSSEALEAWHDLVTHLKSTEEYERFDSFTMGRFIVLTINSSNHYYKITGVPETLEAFDNQFEYMDLKAAIVPSAISTGDRLIHIGKMNEAEALAFKAEEGKGSIELGTFEKKEFEVIDVMKNGQLRFAIYNELGNLIPAADTILSISGRPAKCLWCHETHLLPSFNDTDSIPGYMNGSEFAELIEQRMTTLSAYRTGLSSSLDFAFESDHEQMEIMYISFMEPSIEVLSEEWDMSLESIKNLVAGIPTHQHHEFPFLGELYYRNDIRQYMPFQSLRTPDDARESSTYEPNLIP